MSEYRCPQCGQIAPEPGIVTARRAGYQDGRDCNLMAKNMGVVVPCLAGGTGLCEFCLVGKRWFKNRQIRTVKA